MAAYQSSLPYRIRHEDYVSTDLLAGFTPVRSLVMNPDGVQFPNPPADLSAYVQDFVDVDGIWGPPIAGYNDGFNDVCTDIHGWCSDDIQAWNWRIYTGYEIKHPAVGTLRDPNGGAVALLVINRHDSDEVWNVRNNSGVYVDSGFVGYGPFWFNTDQEGLEEQVPHLLWHYLAQLTQPHPDNHLEGQCGSSALCDSVTWVVVYRSWDRPDLEVDYAHYQLVGWGRYRP